MRVIEKLQRILSEPDARRTQEWLASQLGVSQPTVNRWLGRGADPRGENRDRINELYDRLYSEEGSEIEEVPLVGYVGAGAAAHYYGESQGELDRVRAPKNATKDTVAVEIRGASLGELFERWLVYYDEVRRPVTPDLIGRVCVVGLPDDRVLVKQVKRAKTPGFFHLISNTEQPILDVEIVWAARVLSMEPR